MSLSWLKQWVKSNYRPNGRTTRRIAHQRRRATRLTLEALEDRTLLCASDVLANVANGLHIFGNAANVVGDAVWLNNWYTAHPSPPGSPPPPLPADVKEHWGYLFGNMGNFVGSVVSDIPGNTTKIVGEATTTAGDLGKLGSHLVFRPPGTTLQSRLGDAETLSNLSALTSDANGLAGGPPAVTDFLAGLHDLGDLLNATDWPTRIGAVANIVGDAVAEIGDLMGGCANDKPLQVYASNISGATDFNFAGPVAVFTDPNTAGGKALPPGEYSAEIAWGDGSSSAGQIIANSDGSYSVIGTHTYAAAGDYPLSVLVAGDGATGQSQADATVSQDLQPYSVMDAYPGAIVAGQTFNDSLISFQTNALGSQDEQMYSATINWGDGTTSSGQCVYPQSGRIYVTGSHLYSGPGEYSVSVQVGAPDGSSLSGTTTVSVIPPPQGLSSNSVNVSSTGLTYNGPVATFTDSDGDNNPADYSATIYWGDNSPTSSGQVVANGNGTFSVVAAHTYAQPGIYVLPNVNISDTADGDFTSAYNSTVTVGSMSLTANNFTAPAGLSFSTTVANFTWPDASTPASSFAANVYWGDGSISTSGDVNQDVQIVANGNGSFSIVASHTYGGSGNYSVHIEVQPPSGDAALTASSTATVGTASPSVTAQTLAISPSPSGGSVNGTVATFTAPAGAYTATINWGDGNTSTGQITANSNGTFNVVGSHTYSQMDSYLTSVQVSDNNGNIASAFGIATASPPTSSVNPLPATETSPSFTVSWSGSDPDGAGIASYNVYVSDNGGPFTPWLTNTTQTSATFTGQGGHTYGFYTVATDGLGITQPTPITAQATTTVQISGNNNPGNNNPTNNNPGNDNAGNDNPAPPNVPLLLVWLNQMLGEIKTVDADGTTLTDSFFGIPLVVETYDYFGNLVSATLFGIDITALVESF